MVISTAQFPSSHSAIRATDGVRSPPYSSLHLTYALMDTIAEENSMELEAMRKEDSSWHPCQVSLRRGYGAGLVVDFGSQDSEDVINTREDAVTLLRIRSAPLQGDDCSYIKQGVHVLAAHKTGFKTLFFDAEVEKALKVRHSKRVHCRCTFEIKWLHPEFQGGTVIVPSSSIMKLATNSINSHPVVAAFLSSIKTMNSSGVSPFMPFLDDMDYETDLQRLLEKQIEEISNLANASDKGFSEEILSGLKRVGLKGQKQCKSVIGSQATFPHDQVSLKENHLRRSTRSQSKLQMEMSNEDPPCAPAIPEETFENRSCLSPLAARAALASLMSKLPQKTDFYIDQVDEKGFNSTQNHANMRTLNATNIFMDPDVCIEHNVSMMGGFSLEVKAPSVPIISEHTKIVKLPTSGRRGASKKSQQKEESSRMPIKREKPSSMLDDRKDKISKITTVSTSLTSLVTKGKLNHPINTSRLTRSAVQRGIGNQYDNVELKSCAEGMKSTPTKRTRLTHLAVQKERGDLTMEVKKGPEENKSVQPVENGPTQHTWSDATEGDLITPETSETRKKKSFSSPVDAEIKVSPLQGKNNKGRFSAVTVSEKSEGNGEGGQCGKKSISSKMKPELRFSSRLRFLPRTRSQKKC